LSGTAVAMETADVTLVTEDLTKITESIDLSKKTLQVIKQNLFWAFIYNIVSVPLAAAGLLKPEIASASMAMSSLSVVTNSLRLKSFKKIVNKI
jgi:Cu+-exporting ATPase